MGKNFHDIVDNDNKDVLVMFYNPSCGHCLDFEPIYEQVAEYYKGNSRILVAKIDATINEVEGVPIEGFPTIKFFRAIDKDYPLDYEDDRSTEAII